MLESWVTHTGLTATQKDRIRQQRDSSDLKSTRLYHEPVTKLYTLEVEKQHRNFCQD